MTADPSIDRLEADACVMSTSQFGEDIILRSVLTLHNRLKAGGFYVDIGAHHPIRHSNTHVLNKYHGFKGVNVDADQDLIQEFFRLRPDDVNIHAAVCSDEIDSVEFHVLATRGMSSCDPETLSTRKNFKTLEVRHVQAMTLTKILEQANAPSVFDVLSIDIEGNDLAALQTLDFDRFQPFCICIEELGFDMHRPDQSEIYRLLISKGYKLFSRAWVTSFYFSPKLTNRPKPKN